MLSGNESDAEPMSEDMSKYIIYGSQSHPSIHKREACYKIHDALNKG